MSYHRVLVAHPRLGIYLHHLPEDNLFTSAGQWSRPAAALSSGTHQAHAFSDRDDAERFVAQLRKSSDPMANILGAYSFLTLECKNARHATFTEIRDSGHGWLLDGDVTDLSWQVVITHPEKGLYIGETDGQSPWSLERGDRRETAPAFCNPDDARDHLTEEGLGALAKKCRFHPVLAGEWGLITAPELRLMGLESYIGRLGQASPPQTKVARPSAKAAAAPAGEKTAANRTGRKGASTGFPASLVRRRSVETDGPQI